MSAQTEKTGGYRGRFAPSPTGPLHFGSLVAAVGSYLDARHKGGVWIVRIEDLDTPRCVAGAAGGILRTLDGFGLHSDEDVICQSARTEAYEAALQRLQCIGAVYPCCCTRREIADSALLGVDGPVYPGTCRSGIAEGRSARAWRVRTDLASPSVAVAAQATGTARPTPCGHPSEVTFYDALHGTVVQHLEREIGDFVVKRADGLFAYQLAVVVDDAWQRITDVVRGADLLGSTARQIYLQRLLRLPTPNYLHLPVALNERGEKLSKQTLAEAIECCPSALIEALKFLRQDPPDLLRRCTIAQILAWGIENWNRAALRAPSP